MPSPVRFSPRCLKNSDSDNAMEYTSKEPTFTIRQIAEYLAGWMWHNPAEPDGGWAAAVANAHSQLEDPQDGIDAVCARRTMAEMDALLEGHADALTGFWTANLHKSDFKFPTPMP